ncbi:restriction endonuclease subunit S [Serratia marcescens]|nr:restriction endonuclease subunit S [Serratia marcescens]
MIPISWQKHTVGKLCQSIVPGRNKPKIFDGDIPWVTTPDILGRYIPSKLQKKYVSEEEIKEAGGKLVPEGAVIMAAVGDLGLIAIASESVVLNQQLHAFVCSEKIHNEFLAYWLETQTPYMESVASKTTISYLNKANCESIPVLVPPLPEQIKIAQIISVWDYAIATTEQLLANSQKQKKILMQQLISGARRFSGFGGEWEKLNLNNCVECLDAKRVPLNSEQRSLMRGNIPYWGANGIVDYISKYLFDETIVLLAEDGGYFDEYKTRPISNISYGKSWVNNHAHVLRAKSNCLNEWVYFCLVHKNILAFINEGTRAKLNKKDMLQIIIPLPSKEEQSKIISILSTIDAEINTIKQKLVLLKQEKKALMQQLLTGKRRVKTEA